MRNTIDYFFRLIFPASGTSGNLARETYNLLSFICADAIFANWAQVEGTVKYRQTKSGGAGAGTECEILSWRLHRRGVIPIKKKIQIRRSSSMTMLGLESGDMPDSQRRALWFIFSASAK